MRGSSSHETARIQTETRSRRMVLAVKLGIVAISLDDANSLGYSSF